MNRLYTDPRPFCGPVPVIRAHIRARRVTLPAPCPRVLETLMRVQP
jgi:hypothetical protein